MFQKFIQVGLYLGGAYIRVGGELTGFYGILFFLTSVVPFSRGESKWEAFLTWESNSEDKTRLTIT